MRNDRKFCYAKKRIIAHAPVLWDYTFYPLVKIRTSRSAKKINIINIIELNRTSLCKNNRRTEVIF